MKHKRFAALSLLSAAMLVAAACGGGGNEGTSQPSGTGKAVFAVKDAAADIGAISSIKLTVDQIKVHQQGGAWITASSDTRTVDLLELRAKGTAQLLAETSLKAGTYDQLELDISKVVVVDARGQQEAKLPSNKLQFKGTITVQPGATATATFDFIADQSLHVTGNGRFILAPVMKVEARSNANAQVQANNEVQISGGTTTTDVQVGTNVEGDVDSGLRISPDAILSISASGKIVQTKGQALASGTVKAVDTANGTVTITTKGGTELVLHLAKDSALKVKGSATTLATLSSNIGSEVVAEFNAETKGLTELEASSDAKAKADVGANLSIAGTIKSVNSAAGTVTIAADSGADVVLKVGADSKVLLDGSLSSLLGLGAKVGSRVEAQMNSSTGTVGELKAEAQATANVTGTLKAVDAAAGTVTITAQGGADVVLNVASSSKVLVNGSLATLATLKTLVGAPVSVSFSQQAKEVVDLNAQGKAEQSATVTGVIKAVNPQKGTVTITAGGKDVELNVTAASSIVADGTISALVNLATKIGAQVSAEFNSKTNAASSLDVQGEGGAAATATVQAPATGSATASGTLKAVNAATGTITVASQSGAELVLKVASDTQLTLNGAAATLASLAANLGSQVTVQYNAQTQTATSVSAQGQASASATASGTLKAVNAATGTITITTQSGADLVLKTTADTKIVVEGAANTLVALATKIGSQVTAQYNAQTSTAASVTVQGQASASATATGTLKAVNVLTNQVTIAVQGGADLVLRVTSESTLRASGTATSLVALATKIGSQATVQSNAQTNTVITMDVQG